MRNNHVPLVVAIGLASIADYVVLWYTAIGWLYVTTPRIATDIAECLALCLAALASYQYSFHLLLNWKGQHVWIMLPRLIVT